jgi:ABC-2 type transport system permease protein
MKNIWHILKKEIAQYFISPVAYVVLAIFLVVTGILFYSNVIWYANASFQSLRNPYMVQSLNFSDDFIRPLFANISVILLFLIPALTMRAFAEEKRSGTIELLFTYPIRDLHAIMGKYLAAIVFLVLMILMTLTYPLFLYFVGEPEWGPILSAYMGYFFMGASFVAVGIFTSSTTENQIIAALLAFGINLVLWIAGWMSPGETGTMTDILQYLSMIEHYDPMTKGVINSKNLVYFVSINVFFLFLTSRVLVSKKWRG